MAKSISEEKSELFCLLEQSCLSYAKHKIPSLFSLQSAATILRIVRKYLNPEHCQHGQVDLDLFFTRLAKVEAKVRVDANRGQDCQTFAPIVIVVEESD